MAEFCKQCAEEMCFEADFTDLFKRNDITPGPPANLGFNVLCEGCGIAWIIDDGGTCGAQHCFNKHGTDSPIKSGSREWRERADELNKRIGEGNAKG